LFWALLASSPAMLLYGLLMGFNGAAIGTQLVGMVWLGALVLFWILGLIEAEKGRSDA